MEETAPQQPQTVIMPQDPQTGKKESKKYLLAAVSIVGVSLVISAALLFIASIAKPSKPEQANIKTQTESPSQVTKKISPTPLQTNLSKLNNDQQLEQDILGMDASINAIDSDVASIDSGLNDQQIDPTQ